MLDLNSKDGLPSTQPTTTPAYESFESLLWLGRYVVHAWAAMMYAFTRRSFGRDFFNHWGMSGLLVLSFWALVSVPPDQTVPLSVMMAAFVMLALWHRSHSPQVLFGETLHSRYSGWPLVCDVLPISERTAKSLVEPGVLLMFGYGVAQINESLGLFILFGALACLFDWIYLSRRDYVRAKRIHKAQREQARAIETYNRFFGRKRGGL